MAAGNVAGPEPTEGAGAAPAADAGVTGSEPVQVAGAALPVDAGEAGPQAPSPQRGLLAWMGIVAGGPVLCIALGHAEAALFFACAGVFVLAQATDAAVAFQSYRHWVRDQLPQRSAQGGLFRLVVRSIVPVSGGAFYLGIGVYAWRLGEDAPHRFAAAWSFVAVLISLLLVSRTVADRLTSLFFRTGAIGRTRRLTARLVMLGLMLPVPIQAMFPDLMQNMRESPVPLASPGALVAQLLGEIAVALAGVGWLVRRHWRETLERLGLGAMKPAYAGIVVAGLAGAIVINSGMEWSQHAWFPALWQQDQEVTKLIAGQMPVATALLLGLSAGFGEEVTLRGALQPRLGILLTALFFACGHVQYSWFGMLTIAMLGVLLGLVRRQANTTTAILVHGLYDIFAVITSKA
jgi:hypothetical protein